MSRSRTKKRSKKRPQRAGSGSRHKQAAKRTALEKQQRRRIYAVVIVVALVIATPGAAMILGGGPTQEEIPNDAEAPEVSGRFLVPYEPEDDPAVGMSIPTVAGTDFTGTPVWIEDDGRAKVILFVAHWSADAQAAIRALNPMIRERDLPPNVDVVAVATLNNPARPNYPASAWLEREGWRAPTLADDDPNSAARAFGIPDVPFWVFVGPDGRVVERHPGSMTPDEIEAALARTTG